MADNVLIGFLSGAFVAGFSSLIAYFLSAKQWKDQLLYKNRSIANGFAFEIAEIDDVIAPLVKCYTSGRFPFTSPGLLKIIILHTKSELDSHSSLYNENGLFYHFRKDIYNFDDELTRNLLKFYGSVIQAEKHFQIVMNSTNMDTVVNSCDPFFSNLIAAHALVPEMQSSFGNYVK